MKTNKYQLSMMRGTLVSFVLFTSLFLQSAFADIRVVVVGDQGPLATEEIFDNGDLTGSVDRPSWSVFRELTSEDLIANYDVILISAYADISFDLDWNNILLPFLSAGGGIVWEGYISSSTDSSPLIISQRGNRYVCPNGTICNIPNSPLNVDSVPGLTDGLNDNFTLARGYFLQWDNSLSSFLSAFAPGLGTIDYGLYGEYQSGRIVFTQNSQDDTGERNGSAAAENAYQLLINKIEWAAGSTAGGGGGGGGNQEPTLLTVPDVIGFARATAENTISNEGLTVGNLNFVWDCSRTFPSATVRAQSPSGGAQVTEGSEVNLTISRGYNRRACRRR